VKTELVSRFGTLGVERVMDSTRAQALVFAV
jgi:hypothetical protein